MNFPIRLISWHLRYVTILTLFVQCCLSNEYARLMENLLRGYNKDARPTEKVQDPTVIRANMYPMHVTDLDEKRSILTVETFIIMRWQDSILHWNPDEYGGVYELRIDENRLWKPDIMAFERRGDTSLNWFPVNLIVNNTGWVTWATSATLELVCGAMNYAAYPQDNQKCTMTFGSWSYSKTDVDIITTQENWTNIDEGIPRNPNWKIVAITVKRREQTYEDFDPNPYADLNFDLTIQRQNSPVIHLNWIPTLVSRLLILCMFLTADFTLKFIFSSTSMLMSVTVASTILRDLPSPAASPFALSRVNSTMYLCISAVIIQLLFSVIPRFDFNPPSFLSSLSDRTICQMLMPFCYRPTVKSLVQADDNKEDNENDESKKRKGKELLIMIFEIIVFAVYCVLILAL